MPATSRLPRVARAAVGFTFAAAVLAGCSTSETLVYDSPAELPAEVTATVTTALEKTMAENGVPGAAMAICAEGYEDVVLVKGSADTESGAAVTPELEWPLRSITKSFTVTVLLQLADEGKVDLNDTIDEWFPEIPNASSITLAQLADMSAGVPEYANAEWAKDFMADPGRVFTDEELVAYTDGLPAQFPPGEKRVYTNTATVMIGMIIADVTGEPFPEVLREKILDPLKMSGTYYSETADEWQAEHASGYQPEGSTLVKVDNNFSVFGPAGAMVSTLPDLCRWAEALGSGELLEATTQEARLVGAPLDKGPDYDEYAQGIGRVGNWVGHTGEGLGYTGLVMYNPETKTSVVIFMNLSNSDKGHLPTLLLRELDQTLSEATAAEAADGESG